MSKGKLLTLTLLGLISVTLTACTLQDIPLIGGLFKGSTGIIPQKAVTLNIWGLWENPEVIKSAIARYTQQNPNVTINYDDRSVINPNEYKDRVFARIGQEDVSDIISVHNSWVSSLAPALTPMPSSVMDLNTYKSSFYPTATESAVVDNNAYAIPSYYDGLVLVYNKKHFREKGQLEAPTAWEEFRKLASLLTIRDPQKGTIARAGAAIGTSNNVDFFSDILGSMFVQAKINVPADLDSKSAADAVAFYTNFVKEDKVWDQSFIEASSAFAQEKVSMIFIPSWNLLDILNTRPDLAASIGVAPIPQATKDSPASWGSYWMYAVPKTGKNKNVAWDFLKFLSQQDQQTQMFTEASKYRQYGAPYSLVALKDQLTSNQYLGPLISSAPYAKTSLLAARSGNRKQVEALKEVVNLTLNPVNGTAVDIITLLKSAKEKMLK